MKEEADSRKRKKDQEKRQDKHKDKIKISKNQRERLKRATNRTKLNVERRYRRRKASKLPTEQKKRRKGRPPKQHKIYFPYKEFSDKFRTLFIQKLSVQLNGRLEGFHTKINLDKNQLPEAEVLLTFYEIKRYKLQEKFRPRILAITSELKEWADQQTKRGLKNYLEKIDLNFLENTFEFMMSSQQKLACQAISNRRNEERPHRKQTIQNRIRKNQSIVENYILKQTQFSVQEIMMSEDNICDKKIDLKQECKTCKQDTNCYQKSTQKKTNSKFF